MEAWLAPKPESKRELAEKENNASHKLFGFLKSPNRLQTKAFALVVCQVDLPKGARLITGRQQLTLVLDNHRNSQGRQP